MKVKLHTKIAAIIFLCSFKSVAQTTVEGTVSNVDGVPLHQVSVMLLNPADSSVVNFTFSDKSGHYLLESRIKGTVFLKFSHLGYETKFVKVESAPDGNVHVDPVYLAEKSLFLDEVIVRDESIVVKEDTVVYRADHFMTGSEKTVEDLLKKIPGLQIDKEGTIRVGNQEIEKLMVDGDDLLEKGYKILSKNMPVYPVNEVEVLRNYANNHLLKGVEDSDKVALNLKLHDEFRSIWFGDVDAGLGNSDFYQVQGNLMHFGRKYKTYFLGDLNNTGYDASGNIEHLIHPFRINEPGKIGDDAQAERLISLSPEAPDLGVRRTNFNNAGLTSLNAIFNVNEKVKIKTIGFLNWDELRFWKATLDEVKLADLQFVNTMDYQLRNGKRLGFGKVNLTHNVSKTKMLETATTVNLGDFRDRSRLTFNGNPTAEFLKHKARLLDQEATYTNKLSDKTVYLLSGRVILEEAPQTYTLDQYFYETLFPAITDVDSLRQESNNTMLFAGVNGHLMTRTIQDHLIELQMGAEFRKDKLNSQFALVGNESVYHLPPDFQNVITYQVCDLYMKGKYRYKLKNFGFVGRLEAHQIFNQLERHHFSESQIPFFLNPGIGIDWKANERNKVKLSYSYQTRNAEIQDVYGNFILTGFRSFTTGTGNFSQLRGSDVILNYEHGGWTDRFFVNTVLLFSHNQDFFSNNSMLNPNYALSEKILIKDRIFLSLNSNVDYYLGFISSNLKINLGYSQVEFQNRVNNSELRSVRSGSYLFGLELRSGFDGFFNYHAGTKWTHSEVRTPVRNSFTNNTSFLDMDFIFGPRLNIQLKGERHYFGSLRSHNTYYFLDLEVRYELIDNKLTLGLEGRNLSNTHRFRNLAVSDIGSTTMDYRLLPRLVLLKAEYRF